MDEKLWDPQNDSLLPTPIDPTKPSLGKKTCKLALQKEMNLPLDSEVPVFGVVSRLCRQKGLDLLIKALPELMDKTTAQFIVLGSGILKKNPPFDYSLKNFRTGLPATLVLMMVWLEEFLAGAIFSYAQ